MYTRLQICLVMHESYWKWSAFPSGQFLSPPINGHLSSSLPLAETAPCCRYWPVRLLVRRWRALYPGLSHGSWKETITVVFFFAWDLKVACGGCGVLWEALGSDLRPAPPSYPTSQSPNPSPERA